MTRTATAATTAVREMRDFLFAHGDDHEGAQAGFAWPELAEFNFALEWFDVAGENPDRRVELRAREAERVASGDAGGQHFDRDHR